MTTDYSGGQDPSATLMVSTMNDLPGFRIERVLGEVFGLTVRARNVASSFGSAMKSLKGGELRGQTKMLVDSRMEAMRRLTDEAASRGGNAVLAMRFETSVGELGTEICAYGTACVVSPAT
ncbi:MAG: YbjQ family protein [Catenulispora sp.]|nr:YbjQ family protein [Catenulispora sp.]